MKKSFFICIFTSTVFLSSAQFKPAVTKSQTHICSDSVFAPWKTVSKVSYFVDTAGWLTKQTVERSYTITSVSDSFGGFLKDRSNAIFPEKTTRFYPGAVTTERYAKAPLDSRFDSAQVKSLLEGNYVPYKTFVQSYESSRFKEAPLKYILLDPFFGFEENRVSSAVLRDGQIEVSNSFLIPNTNSGRIKMTHGLNIFLALFIFFSCYQNWKPGVRKWAAFLVVPGALTLFVAVAGGCVAFRPDTGFLEFFKFSWMLIVPWTWFHLIYLALFIGIDKLISLYLAEEVQAT